MKRGRIPSRNLSIVTGGTDSDAVRRLLQVHPISSAPDDILSISVHLLGHFASKEGKEPPALSEDAARFLTARRWVLADLASRLARAVSSNQGSLITAADLV